MMWYLYIYLKHMICDRKLLLLELFCGFWIITRVLINATTLPFRHLELHASQRHPITTYEYSIKRHDF